MWCTSRLQQKKQTTHALAEAALGRQNCSNRTILMGCDCRCRSQFHRQSQILPSIAVTLDCNFFRHQKLPLLPSQVAKVAPCEYQRRMARSLSFGSCGKTLSPSIPVFPPPNVATVVVTSRQNCAGGPVWWEEEDGEEVVFWIFGKNLQ